MGESHHRIRDLTLGALVGGLLVLVGRGTGSGGGLDRVLAAPRAVGSGDLLMVSTPSGQGGALLFVLDAKERVLNVYEAQGGTRATRGLVFVASRKIARDRYVTGYNDQSEYTYEDLGRLIEAETPAGEGGDEGDSQGGAGNGPGGSGRR